MFFVVFPFFLPSNQKAPFAENAALAGFFRRTRCLARANFGHVCARAKIAFQHAEAAHTDFNLAWEMLEEPKYSGIAKMASQPGNIEKRTFGQFEQLNSR